MSTPTQNVSGSVVSLWRYPVKSMMGEELNASDITDRGLLGDRAYALIDSSNGKVASAKNPRKWGKLFDFRAAFVAPPRTGENPWTASLEEYWPDIDGLAHREVITDEAMPEGTFFDLAVIHVLTTATIDRLRELYPQGRFEVRRFRPNIVVETSSGEKGFVENDWVGKTLAIGEEVRLTITGPCPRCVMTTLPQGDLPKDPGILRTAARHNQVNVGVYGSVERGGRIRRGDSVKVE